MWKRLTGRSARSRADSDDPRLAGRTYAIPFGTVWDAAAQLAGGRLRGWAATRLDDQNGVLEGRVRGPLRLLAADFVITVTLDENAQTRVDLTVQGRRPGGDFGVNTWRVGRFCGALDRALGAGPRQVLNVRIRGARAA